MVRNGLWAALLCVAGCAAQAANGSEQDDGAAGAGGQGGADTALVADLEQALADIPEATRPAELLVELADQLLLPPASPGGLALFTGIVTVEPGDDVTYCTYLDYVTDEVLHVHDTLGVQSRYGHHAILQYLTTPQEPGTRACPDESDLSAQPGQVLGGTGGEGNGAIELPPNVVSEIPAGAQLVINHHWINYGQEPARVQAEMITVPPTSHDDLIVARAMAIVATDFEVPVGAAATASVECMFPSEARLVSMIGHQHEWGTHVRAERMGPSAEVIFDHDYTPEMVSQPLTTDFALEQPFTFAPGDVVRMTCEWQNTSNAPLIFPREMCVLFGWQIGVEKDVQCVNGNWL